MERHFNYQPPGPTLFLIPTPIGNLEDMTMRAITTLKTVDDLFAEDTRVSLTLLRYYHIDKPLRSYHDHNKATQTPVILELLKSGRSVGLISDAGMPLLSDPGYEIAQAAISEGYHVVALPGANAAITGLAMSGIRPYPFLFYGFLNARSSKRKAELEVLKKHTETLIFYEAPHRIESTLSDMYDVWGDRNACVAREISKKFEEMIRGTLSELRSLSDLKGEMVIIVEGTQIEDLADDSRSIIERVDTYIADGLEKNDALKRVAHDLSISKSTVYKEYLQK